MMIKEFHSCSLWNQLCWARWTICGHWWTTWTLEWLMQRHMKLHCDCQVMSSQQSFIPINMEKSFCYSWIRINQCTVKFKDVEGLRINLEDVQDNYINRFLVSSMEKLIVIFAQVVTLTKPIGYLATRSPSFYQLRYPDWGLGWSFSSKREIPFHFTKPSLPLVQAFVTTRVKCIPATRRDANDNVSHYRWNLQSRRPPCCHSFSAFVSKPVSGLEAHRQISHLTKCGKDAMWGD
jgi:hypothetical protein